MSFARYWKKSFHSDGGVEGEQAQRLLGALVGRWRVNIEWPTLSLAILFNFIISAIISSWVTHKFALGREAQSKKNQERYIRQALHAEIQYNKEVLKGIVNLIRAEEQKYAETFVQDSYGEVNAEGDPAKALSQFSTDRLSQDVWNSQVERVPSILSAQEVENLFVFYKTLAHIRSLHAEYVSGQARGSLASYDRLKRIMALMEETVNKPLSIIR